MKKGVFITTDNVSRFQRAVQMARDTEHGRPGMLLAFGEAGRGKTLAAMNAYAEGGGCYLRVWEGWSQHAFLQAVCFEVTGGRPHGANRCKVAAIEALGREPRTIYVDEADRLDVRRIEDLRDIHDETGCPIMLIGEQALLSRVAARSRIDDRIPPEHRIQFQPISPRDITLYAMEAAGLQLTSEACAAVHRMSKGNFRKAHNLLLSLEQMSRAAETDLVDAEMTTRLEAKAA
ncbi:MAG: AAA family ATPase [Deltaproteobacteria bacterium]|nr:AAA family ATPase [Deltaproteobacteria bacterium]